MKLGLISHLVVKHPIYPVKGAESVWECLASFASFVCRRIEIPPPTRVANKQVVTQAVHVSARSGIRDEKNASTPFDSRDNMTSLSLFYTTPTLKK